MTLCILPPSADVAAVALGCNTVHSATIQRSLRQLAAVALWAHARLWLTPRAAGKEYTAAIESKQVAQQDAEVTAETAAYARMLPPSAPQWRNLESVLWCGVHTLFRRLALVDCADPKGRQARSAHPVEYSALQLSTTGCT